MSVHSIQQSTKIFNDDFLYGPAEVKQKLSIGQTAFRELLDSGALPFIKISERTRKFRGETLNRLFCEVTK